MAIISLPQTGLDRADRYDTTDANIEQCIHELIDEQTAQYPQAIAIESQDVSFSFSDLSGTSSRLAEHLVALGVHSESRVAILMERSPYYPVAVVGALKSGAVFVPLDTTHPQKRLHQLIEEIDPVLIITSSQSREKAYSLHKNVVIVDQTHMTWPTPKRGIQTRIDVNSAAYIIFTSGSTGKPKGVVIEHRAFLASALARGRQTGLSSRSRVLQYAAHTFDVSVDEILSTLIHGGCVCIPTYADRLLLVPAINKLRVNHALLTPTSAKMLEPAEVPGLDTLQLGGELMSDELIKTWSYRVRLFNVYGPTEASVACILNEKTRDDEPGNVIGLPAGCVRRIVDPDNHNQLLPAGTVGELIIGGPILAREYWKDPARTANSFIAAPSWAKNITTDSSATLRFYKTGDLAQIDDNGLTRIHGRKDNQVKVRGQRINVEEIESALLSTGLVRSVVVDLPKKGRLANKLSAVLSITASPEPPSSFQDLPAFSRARILYEGIQSQLYQALSDSLPPAMIPVRWIELDYLPQSSSTKTDRKMVRTWIEEMNHETFKSIFESSASTTASSPGETALDTPYQDILCRVLGITPIQIRPSLSFIRNGGDSISAMELRRLGKEVGISFGIGDILSSYSLQDLHRVSMARQEKLLVSQDKPETPFALSPVQKFFFDITGEGSDIFTQSVELELVEEVSSEALRRIMDKLVLAHPMLRAQFSLSSGEWLQSINPAIEGSYSISLSQTIASLDSSAKNQSSMSVTDPVFHVQVWESDTGVRRLQLVAHHLVIDLMSWRIILHDLAKLLRHESLPQEATTSFQTWCSLQRQYTKTLNPDRVLPFPVIPDNCQYWYPEAEPLCNTHGETSELTFRLGGSTARALLDPGRDVQPVEIMVGLFYKAFAETFSDRETPRIFFESHGREPWHSGIDISRTVGWFTTAYPVHVPAQLAADTETSIITTAHRKRSVPANGHPYWCHRFSDESSKDHKSSPMEFVFNFSGHFQQFAREDSPFRVLSTVGHETAHPQARRLSIFDIFVSVESDELRFTITFPSKISHRSKLDSLSRTWKELLDSTDLDGESLRVLPPALSNFPEDVQLQLRESNINNKTDVMSAYWVSDLQNHMLVSQAQNPLFYQVGSTWRFRTLASGEEASVSRLQDAWRQVVANHPNLRTTFVYSNDRQRFVAVVLGKSVPVVTFNTKCYPQHLDKRQDLLATAQKALLPPHQITIEGANEDSIYFSMNISHAVMDATSRSVLLEELLDAYLGRHPLPDNSCYKTYIEDRALHQAPHYGRKDIDCIFPSDPQIRDADRDSIATVPVPGGIYGTKMVQICGQLGVTASALVFAAWSLVLSKCSAKTDVAFAYVASDRDGNISGIERSIGLYVDLLIMNVDVATHSLLWDLARDIQQGPGEEGGARLRAAAVAQNGRSDGQINTMVNVRSAGIDSLDLRRDDLELTMQEFEDRWNYDLVLAVDICQDNEINCTLEYRSSAIAAELAASAARMLSATLDLLLSNPRLTEADWKTST